MNVNSEVLFLKQQLEDVVFDGTDLVERTEAIDQIEDALNGWVMLMRGRSYYEAASLFSLQGIADRIGKHYDTVRDGAHRYRVLTGKPRLRQMRRHDVIPEGVRRVSPDRRR